MSNRNRIVVVVAIFFLSAFLGTMTLIGAEGEEGKATSSFDLSEVSCWDVMTVHEQERGVVLFLLYGYVAGERKATVHTGPDIETSLRAVGEYCAENPDALALEAMRNIAK